MCVCVCVWFSKESMTPNKLRTTVLEAKATAYPSFSSIGERISQWLPWVISPAAFLMHQRSCLNYSLSTGRGVLMVMFTRMKTSPQFPTLNTTYKNTIRGIDKWCTLQSLRQGIFQSRKRYLTLPIQRKGISPEERMNAILNEQDKNWKLWTWVLSFRMLQNNSKASVTIS